MRDAPVVMRANGKFKIPVAHTFGATQRSLRWWSLLSDAAISIIFLPLVFLPTIHRRAYGYVPSSWRRIFLLSRIIRGGYLGEDTRRFCWAIVNCYVVRITEKSLEENCICCGFLAFFLFSRPLTYWLRLEATHRLCSKKCVGKVEAQLLLLCFCSWRWV